MPSPIPVMADIITKKLEDSLHPDHIDLVNQSHLHEGHAGHDGSGESHFKLTVVSSAFEGISRPERHRMIYTLLVDELKNKVHALSIKAMTPDEHKRLVVK